MTTDPADKVRELETKIRADFLFLKLLMDGQALKPDHERRVYTRLAETIRNYPHLFPEDWHGAKSSEGPAETNDRDKADSDVR
jgi:hypothetical protein